MLCVSSESGVGKGGLTETDCDDCAAHLLIRLKQVRVFAQCSQDVDSRHVRMPGSYQYEQGHTIRNEQQGLGATILPTAG